MFYTWSGEPTENHYSQTNQYPYKYPATSGSCMQLLWLQGDFKNLNITRIAKLFSTSLEGLRNWPHESQPVLSVLSLVVSFGQPCEMCQNCELWWHLWREGKIEKCSQLTVGKHFSHLSCAQTIIEGPYEGNYYSMGQHTGGCLYRS